MRDWSKDEIAALIKAVLDGEVAGDFAAKVNRTRDAVRNKAARLDLMFGKGHVPGLNARYEASRFRTRPPTRDPDKCREGGDWDVKTFEPYAVFKARKQRERASA